MRFLVLLLGSLCHFAFGAQVHFLSSPATLSSPTLNIRCSLTDEMVSTVFGRRTTTPMAELIRSSRAVAHVTSIVINRSSGGVNETVADVSVFEAAKAVADVQNLQVDGNVASPTTGEFAYIDLTWTNPTSAQDGDYYCNIFTLNDEQRPENFQEMLTVKLEEQTQSEMTLPELMAYVQQIETRTLALEQELAQLQANGGQSSTVQTGTVDCHQNTHQYHVTFDTAFATQPTIFTAIGGAHSGDAFMEAPSIGQLTTLGFTLHCSAHGNTVTVSWLAV